MILQVQNVFEFEFASLPPIQECAFSSTDINELERLIIINDGTEFSNSKVLNAAKQCGYKYLCPWG